MKDLFLFVSLSSAPNIKWRAIYFSSGSLVGLQAAFCSGWKYLSFSENCALSTAALLRWLLGNLLASPVRSPIRALKLSLGGRGPIWYDWGAAFLFKHRRGGTHVMIRIWWLFALRAVHFHHVVIHICTLFFDTTGFGWRVELAHLWFIFICLLRNHIVTSRLLASTILLRVRSIHMIKLHTILHFD